MRILGWHWRDLVFLATIRLGRIPPFHRGKLGLWFFLHVTEPVYRWSNTP